MEGISCNFNDEPNLINDWINERFISVAWNIPDLTNFPTIESIKKILIENGDNTFNGPQQLMKFRELEIGTRILTHHPELRMFYIGTITSAYIYQENNNLHNHIRRMNWDNFILVRDEFDQKTLNFLTKPHTIFHINENTAELVETHIGNLRG